MYFLRHWPILVAFYALAPFLNTQARPPFSMTGMPINSDINRRRNLLNS